MIGESKFKCEACKKFTLMRPMIRARYGYSKCDWCKGLAFLYMSEQPPLGGGILRNQLQGYFQADPKINLLNA